MGEPLIFISYLRRTGGGWAQVIFDRLVTHFDATEIFFDRDPGDVPLGDFWVAIARVLHSCPVVFAVIDQQWASTLRDLVGSSSKRASRRKGHALPKMCDELILAINLDRVVVPLVIDGNRMPSLDGLPRPLERLATFNAFGIHPDLLDQSIDNLIAKIGPVIRSRAQVETQARKASGYEVSFGLAPGSLGFMTRGMLTPDEKAKVDSMRPRERALFLLQKRMHEAEQDGQLQEQRRKTALDIIARIQ